MRSKSNLTPEIALPAGVDRFPTYEEFEAFALQVPVSSRDSGYGPIHLWGTQRELVRQILDGLRQGYRQFLVAKAGQVGATLVMQLLILYWMLRYAGIQGIFIAEADDTRDYCRDNLTEMAREAPGTVPFRVNNKNIGALENGSRVLFATAGLRTGSRLGVGRGVALAHATEVALWKNPQAMTILRTRFSDLHPHRLFVFESTARGRNWWFDVWEEAGAAGDVCRIFLGWWLREDRVILRTDPLFETFWDGRLTGRERRWSKEIARRYKRQLTPEQWAWRRWYVKAKAGGDDRTADQEMPTLVEDSFEATGISFLSLEAVRRCRRTVAASEAPKRWRYEFGLHIEDTKIKPTIPNYGQLAVWEEPLQAEGYVVAAVPANSANPDCLVNVLSVWKASRDALLQVAEFADDECGIQAFAWVCAHLAGAYAAPRRGFILEIGGSGAGVLKELKQLLHSGWGTARKPALNDLMGGLRHYIWRRPDSWGGGVLQWKSSSDLRSWTMRRLRDQLASGTVTIRSEKCLDEMERIRQTGDDFMPEGKKAEDHRVVAAALAVESWSTQLVPLFQKTQGPSSKATDVVSRMMETWFDRIGVKPQPAAGGRR